MTYNATIYTVNVLGNSSEFFATTRFPSVTISSPGWCSGVGLATGDGVAAGEGLQPPLKILGYKTSTTTMNRDSVWCQPFDISLKIYPKVPGLFTSSLKTV